jgi:hypothetical protein
MIALIDPEREAEQMAQIFFSLSQAVDRFRLTHWAELSEQKRADLKEQAQALDVRAHGFTAQAIGAFLSRIQPQLRAIRQAGEDAKHALDRLQAVAKGIAIVDAAVAVAADIASGNVESIGTSVEGLLETLQ